MFRPITADLAHNLCNALRDLPIRTGFKCVDYNIGIIIYGGKRVTDCRTLLIYIIIYDNIFVNDNINERGSRLRKNFYLI